jgi:hypothetical protein
MEATNPARLATTIVRFSVAVTDRECG